MFLGFFFFAEFHECGSSPCTNGGNCTDEIGYFVCECIPGYTGIHCETGRSNNKEKMSAEYSLVMEVKVNL